MPLSVCLAHWRKRGNLPFAVGVAGEAHTQLAKYFAVHLVEHHGAVHLAAFKLWKHFQPDVIVSDIDMPIMDGIEMVKKIREIDGDTIILFTTGLTSPKDLKAGYAAGANNYVKKPFVPEELDAHIQSLMRLKQGKRSLDNSHLIKLGKYILHADHATLKNQEDGTEKMLTAREAKILELLAVNKNDVVRREAVLSRFWGVEDKDYFASRSLDVFIKKIRTAIEDEPSVELKTIRGIGFKLIVE